MCLTLDAVLAAYGVCFYQLQETVKFAPWLAQRGLRYLNVSPKTQPASEVASLDQRIIQRRVLWLVKCCLYPLQPSAHVRFQTDGVSWARTRATYLLVGLQQQKSRSRWNMLPVEPVTTTLAGPTISASPFGFAVT